MFPWKLLAIIPRLVVFPDSLRYPCTHFPQLVYGGGTCSLDCGRKTVDITIKSPIPIKATYGVSSGGTGVGLNLAFDLRELPSPC